VAGNPVDATGIGLVERDKRIASYNKMVLTHDEDQNEPKTNL
jgi:hypothetical protein